MNVYANRGTPAYGWAWKSTHWFRKWIQSPLPAGHDMQDRSPETQHMRSLDWNPFPLIAHTAQKLMRWAACSLAVHALWILLRDSFWHIITFNGSACMLKFSWIVLQAFNMLMASPGCVHPISRQLASESVRSMPDAVASKGNGFDRCSEPSPSTIDVMGPCAFVVPCVADCFPAFLCWLLFLFSDNCTVGAFLNNAGRNGYSSASALNWEGIMWAFLSSGSESFTILNLKNIHLFQS
jgi:hypothetical protein